MGGEPAIWATHPYWKSMQARNLQELQEAMEMRQTREFPCAPAIGVHRPLCDCKWGPKEEGK